MQATHAKYKQAEEVIVETYEGSNAPQKCMNPPRTKANKHNNSMQKFSNVGANPHPKTFLFWLKANEEGQNAGSNNDQQCVVCSKFESNMGGVGFLRGICSNVVHLENLSSGVNLCPVT